jgi:hypothetical protein
MMVFVFIDTDKACFVLLGEQVVEVSPVSASCEWKLTSVRCELETPSKGAFSM